MPKAMPKEVGEKKGRKAAEAAADFEIVCAPEMMGNPQRGVQKVREERREGRRRGEEH